MKLLEIHTDTGQVCARRVLEYSTLFGKTHFIVDAPYSRGGQTQHFLVEDSELVRIDLRIDCPTRPPYIAIAAPAPEGSREPSSGAILRR